MYYIYVKSSCLLLIIWGWKYHVITMINKRVRPISTPQPPKWRRFEWNCKRGKTYDLHVNPSMHLKCHLRLFLYDKILMSSQVKSNINLHSFSWEVNGHSLNLSICIFVPYAFNRGAFMGLGILLVFSSLQSGQNYIQ